MAQIADRGMRLIIAFFQSLKIVYLMIKQTITRKLPETFVRYDDFNISNRQGMRPTRLINSIFEMNLSITVIHHPAKLI